jgi:predicted HD phosphohydrolase
LCAVEKEYGKALSGASKVCLRFQVGPMVAEDVKAWKEGEWWEESIALRKCDDAAKEVDLEVAGVEAY